MPAPHRPHSRLPNVTALPVHDPRPHAAAKQAYTQVVNYTAEPLAEQEA